MGSNNAKAMSDKYQSLTVHQRCLPSKEVF